MLVCLCVNLFSGLLCSFCFHNKIYLIVYGVHKLYKFRCILFFAFSCAMCALHLFNSLQHCWMRVRSTRRKLFSLPFFYCDRLQKSTRHFFYHRLEMSFFYFVARGSLMLTQTHFTYGEYLMYKVVFSSTKMISFYVYLTSLFIWLVCTSRVSVCVCVRG